MVNKKNSSVKKNFFWQLCIEITNMLLPLVTSPILSRRLGAESIGIYSYVYSISYCFIIIAVLGIFQYGTREIALVRDDKDKLNTKFTELLFAQLLIGSIVFVLYLLFSIFVSKYPKLFLIQSISLLGSSLILINWLFSGLEEFKTIALKTMIIRFLGVVSIVLFVKSSSNLPIYFIIMALEPLIGAIVYISMARNKVKIVKVSYKNVLSHFKGMGLLFIPVLTTYLYSSMDKVMLGHISSMEQLGLYENATKALIAKNLATALSTVLIPRMSSLIGQNNKDEFKKVLDKSINVVFLLTVAFGFGTGAISKTFSVVFWGNSFAGCSSLILVMSLTLPAYGITYVINNQLLVPRKKERIYIKATVLGVILNFVLNIILIRKYSALGAAIATLITQYFVMIYESVKISSDLNILKCIKFNFIYLIFGFLMLLSIKIIELFLSYTIINLFFEIIIGFLIFGLFSVVYWVLSHQYEYIDILKKLLKIRRKL